MIARGSRGVDVTELQQNLKALGYNPGPIDGIFGGSTHEAVIKLQDRYGLKTDGVVGPQTQTQIRKLLARLRPLQGFSDVVDPGHGGNDPGAVDGVSLTENDRLKTEEEDIDLAIAQRLHNKLVAQGARSTMTRSSDWYPTLEKRYQMANNFKADVFLGVHANSGPAAAAGIETLYNPNRTGSLRLAQLVQQELVRSTGQPNRGVKPRTNVAVLNGTHMPAVIAEIGFITNPGEERKLNDPVYRELIANAYTRAVIRYKKGEHA